MRFARLLLKQHQPAIFSERAATEGVHKTLPYVPGAAMLGWAARHYDEFAEPFTLFHSGKVRFSNAVPLVGGKPAFPVPQLLMRAKHDNEPVPVDCLDKKRLWVGRAKNNANQDGQESQLQLESLKDGFVTAEGRLFKPDLGARLRTATYKGHAATGQLFGYGHINAKAGQPYAATIEADDGAIDHRDWDRLVAAFDGKELFLGRGSGAAYGGDYSCSVEAPNPQQDIWHAPPSSITDTNIRVWVLSDLALLDERGVPCFAPTGAMLGLPGAKLLPKESAISVRRYAPWNAFLDCRDVERQVIQAGSVLTFELETQLTGTASRAFGLWQEAGLGRVWIAPGMLSVETGTNPNITVMPIEASEEPDLPEAKPADDEGSPSPWTRAVRYLNGEVRAND